MAFKPVRGNLERLLKQNQRDQRTFPQNPNERLVINAGDNTIKRMDQADEDDDKVLSEIPQDVFAVSEGCTG